MSAKFISVLALVLSLLPLSTNQAAGSLAGRIIWICRARARRITEINLRLCYPNLSENDRRKLAFESVLETGRQLTESAWVWHRPVQQSLDRIVEIRGEEHLTSASESSKGLIVVSPHIGNWELCTLLMSRTNTFTYLYRSPRNRVMDDLLIKWRAHLGGQPARLDTAGIREALRVLKNGDRLGILPDQEPDLQNGVYAPFFNVPALTMTLLPKLARRSKAHVLFFVVERLPNAHGWRLHILRANPRISSANLEEATAAVNTDVERCIEICPRQYLWNYKRFSTLKDGSRRYYK